MGGVEESGKIMLPWGLGVTFRNGPLNLYGDGVRPRT